LAAKSNGTLSHAVMISSAVARTGHARYVRLLRFSFLILIGRFVTLEP